MIDALERLREVVAKAFPADGSDGEHHDLEVMAFAAYRALKSIADPGMVEELARVFDNEAAKRLGLSVTWKQLAEIVLNHLASRALEGEDE